MTNYVFSFINNKDKITEMVICGATTKEIANVIGFNVSNLFYLLQDAKYITNNNYKFLNTIKEKDLLSEEFYNSNKNKFNKECIEEEWKCFRDVYTSVSRIYEAEEEKIKAVEQQLLKACYDHKVKYMTISKKDGQPVEVEQVIPASYNAQRFYLINRHPKRWANENKEIAVSTNGKVQAISVKLVKSDDEMSKKKVAKLMEEVKDGNSEN